MKRILLHRIACGFSLVILSLVNSFAIDLQILSGFYTVSPYPGYPSTGTYKIELSKDNYTFDPSQFQLNITLPAQGGYDVARASEAVIPAGWELIVNSPTSLVLRATVPYAGTGAPINRRKDFLLPILASAAAVDAPSQVSVQWNDPTVTESPGANNSGSVLNVADVPLPVTLIAFKATKEGSSTNLTWQTTQETNSDYFVVQHSTNAKNWVALTKIESHKDSKELNTYNHAHASPAQGLNYYRLKMVDQDLTFAYSEIKSLDFEGGAGFYVFPNPVTEKVKFNNFEQIGEAAILNQSGVSLLATSKLTAEGLDVRNLQNGLYMLRIKDLEGNTSIRKFVIRK